MCVEFSSSRTSGSHCTADVSSTAVLQPIRPRLLPEHFDVNQKYLSEEQDGLKSVGL